LALDGLGAARGSVGAAPAPPAAGCKGLGVFDLQGRADAAGAPVLELHHRLDELLGLATVQAIDQRQVLVGDEAAADLVGTGQFTVIGVELLVQHQEAADLAARQQFVRGQVGIDLLDAVLDQCVDLGLLGQVGVTGVRQVAALGPVADGIHVDVDHHADLVAAVTVGHHLLDVREELQLVFDILGRKHRAVVGTTLDAADVLDAVDDLQMAMRIEEAGVAGVVPTIRGQYFGGCGRVLEILLEQARRLDQDLAVVRHLDLDAGDRHAHRVGARRVVGLQADEHRGLGGAIELLEVDADGAVELEQVRPDRLAGGIGHPHAAQAEVVAQGPIDHPVAQAIQQAVGQAQRLAVHAVRADPAGQRHEGVEHPALERARILHADHHAGEQALEDPRRREVVGRADFLEVDRHRGRRLRAIDHVATGQPLRIAEDVLPDPGRRQIGQHLLVLRQLVEVGAGARPVEQAVVGMDHALGIAGRARGEEHRGNVVGPGLFDLLAKERGMELGEHLAGRDQFVHGRQARLVVVAQAAGIVKVDMGQLRALFADLQQLVDLLLVFGKGKCHVGVVDRKHAFSGHRILVQRDGHRSERLHRQHRGIQARPVGAHHDHVVVAPQAGLVQPAGDLLDHLLQVGPAQRLPDAEFLLAHGGGRGPRACVFEQQSGKRGLQGCLLEIHVARWLRLLHRLRPALGLCNKYRIEFDVDLSVGRQFKGNGG
jgi:hypothetical protein